MRSVAGWSSTSANSSPSAPLASSHIHRATGRPPTSGSISAHSCRHVTVPSSSIDSVAGGQLPRPLVGDERIDDVVQVACQHVGEPVDGEADAVVGDAVLLVVVGANLLAASSA